MCTNRSHSSSLVFLLATVVSLLFAGADQALAQQQDTLLQGCIDQWRASMADACAENDQVTREFLYDRANDELGACLLAPPPNQPAKPPNCKSDTYKLWKEKNCGGAPGDCVHHPDEYARECRRTARTIYRWCLGLADPTVPAATTPRWEQYPTSVKVGDNYLLTVTTDDPAVDRVRFFAIRMDAPETAADPVFEIGNAGSTPLGGNAVRWSLTTDTGTWPLENGEERIIIFAQSETFTSPTATQILDISTLIEVEIKQ